MKQYVPNFDSYLKESKEIKLQEGNAFLAARAKAIEEDKEEFEFNGKTYKVTYKTKKVNEETLSKEVSTSNKR